MKFYKINHWLINLEHIHAIKFEDDGTTISFFDQTNTPFQIDCGNERFEIWKDLQSIILPRGIKNE